MTYTKKEKLEILRGQCLNNATMVVIFRHVGEVPDDEKVIKEILDLAKKMFDEAQKRWKLE